jgi:hypothetical protein
MDANNNEKVIPYSSFIWLTGMAFGEKRLIRHEDISEVSPNINPDGESIPSSLVHMASTKRVILVKETPAEIARLIFHTENPE